MKKTVPVGTQDFKRLIDENLFYIDKTLFIKEWWESSDDITLITRPRRFGKTLTMSMVNYFFNIDGGGAGLFNNLKIFKEEKYRNLQGIYPVISISFANVKSDNLDEMIVKICKTIGNVYFQYFEVVKNSKKISQSDKKVFVSKYERFIDNWNKFDIGDSIQYLASLLYKEYDKKVIILIDEYDTPMMEAYVNGFWDKIVTIFRGLFNSTLKTNNYLYRGILTGITRVSKESLFSDLNNLKVCTLLSSDYQDKFGFTEEEVFSSLGEYGFENKEEVKKWYDGFTIGNKNNMYNPWSIINFLRSGGEFAPYWANTSSNSLISKLLLNGSPSVKKEFEDLLKGKSIVRSIKEEFVYSNLSWDSTAIWDLLFCSGYLNARVVLGKDISLNKYSLSLVNFEVKIMFKNLIKDWFNRGNVNNELVIDSLLNEDLENLNRYINKLTLSTISYYDAEYKDDEFDAPEMFYHGFVLGLISCLEDEFDIKSNRESGYGRYDIMMMPRDKNRKGYIIEFKVAKTGQDLEDVLKVALNQIEEKKYEQNLLDIGVKKENIVKYGFVFKGKEVLIGKA